MNYCLFFPFLYFYDPSICFVNGSFIVCMCVFSHSLALYLLSEDIIPST